ncbi:hypothetical protein [Streptomyces adonidis]
MNGAAAGTAVSTPQRWVNSWAYSSSMRAALNRCSAARLSSASPVAAVQA